MGTIEVKNGNKGKLNGILDVVLFFILRPLRPMAVEFKDCGCYSLS